MIEIDIRTNFEQLQRDLTLLEREQIPFATALALTDIAAQVREAEVDSLTEVFDRPTPFTQRSIGVSPATKRRWVATVFVRDIASTYLEPFEFGGPHHLGTKQAILKPVAQRVNKYGNLPPGTLRRLRGRQNVFVGGIETKRGMVHGVWEKVDLNAKGGKRRKRARSTIRSKEHGRLRLLVRFEDPQPVKQTWGYFDRARDVVSQATGPAWDAAFRRAAGSP